MALRPFDRLQMASAVHFAVKINCIFSIKLFFLGSCQHPNSVVILQLLFLLLAGEIYTTIVIQSFLPTVVTVRLMLLVVRRSVLLWLNATSISCR